MNAIRKSRLSRRTLLRSLGVTMALPWLDAMGSARPVAAAPRRVLFIYIPNGVIQKAWVPTQTGSAFDLPVSLKPMEAIRDKVTVVSGLDRHFVSGTGVHAQCGACWLTSSPPSEVLDGGFPTNISLDQVLAREFAKQPNGDTLLPSLELSCNDHSDNKETRYFESISWIGPGYAANVEKNPRAVFQRLFGNPGADPRTRSVLDVVLSDARRLRAGLGAIDQQKLDEYFESVRGVERRIQKAESLAATRRQAPIPEPQGIPEDRGAYIRLMGQLAALAFQLDLTRVATLVIDPERWDSPRQYQGVFDKPENHHQLTHTKGAEAVEKLIKIDTFHVEQFTAIVQAMASVREGESSLLDSSTVVMGSGLGDGSIHSYKDLPLLIAGNAGGTLQTGQHISCGGERPLADLWLTLLEANGIRRDRFADSSGKLSQLLASTA